MILFIGSNYWDTILSVEKTVSSDTVFSKETHSGPGGNACNSASTASLLVPTSLITILGEDSLARKISERLDDRGAVIYSPVYTKNTKKAWVILKGSARTIYIEKRERSLPSPDQKSLEMIERAKVVDFYPSIIKEIGPWHKAAEGKLRVRSPIDIEQEVVLGRKWEVLVGSKEHTKSVSEDFLEKLGCRLVVLTDAERGGEWWSEVSGWQKYSSFPAKDLGDSVGAGDAFRAGLVVGLERGLPYQECIRLASHLGSLAIQDFGAWISPERISLI